MNTKQAKNIENTSKKKKTCTRCPCCYYDIKNEKKLVSCPKCEVEICLTCVQEFLLQNEKIIAECPLCKHEWNDEFVRNNTPKVFHNNKYRKYKSTVAMNIEKSLFPSVMPAVQIEKTRRKRNEGLKILKEERRLLKARLREINTDIYNIEMMNRYPDHVAAEESKGDDKDDYYTRPCPSPEDCKGSLNNRGKCGLCDIKVCLKCNTIKKEDDDKHECNIDDVESTKLIMHETVPCPKCKTRIYKIAGCFEPNTIIPMWNGENKLAKEIIKGDILIGDNGTKRTVQSLIDGTDMMYEICQNKADNYIVNSEHTLVLINGGNNEIVEIKVKDYINLPKSTQKILYGYRIPDKKCVSTNYLHTSIKILEKGIGKFYGWQIDENNRFILDDCTVVKNCSHMFCVRVGCYTSFDWKSGREIDDSKNTNPHYYAYKVANGGMPRNPLDIPCGGPDLNRILYVFTTFGGDGRTGAELIRIIAHNLNVVLPTYRPAGIRDNMDLAVKYLMNEMPDVKYESELKKRHKNREKLQAVYPVLEMYIQIMTDILVTISSVTSSRNFNMLIFEMEKLSEYTNTELEKLENEFNNVIPRIQDFYIVTKISLPVTI